MFKGLLREDVNSVFGHSILMYEGNPVFIHGSVDGYKVSAFNILNGEQLEFDVRGDGLSLRGLNTGNVNINNNVVHFSRHPLRQYKQGISRDNIRITKAARNCRGIEYRMGADFVKRLDTNVLKDALVNKYPSLEECLNKVSKDSTEFAFDRQFSVDKYFRLFYKKDFVGTVDDQNGQIYLSKNKEYLRSFL